LNVSSSHTGVYFPLWHDITDIMLFIPPNGAIVSSLNGCLFVVVFTIFVLNYDVLAAEEQGSSGLNLEHYFSITPKILENGTQNDISFGLFYTQDFKFGSDVRIQTIKTSELGEIWEIADSMSTGETLVSGNTRYRSEGKCLIQISNNSLVLGCKNSVIPAGMTSIGSYAFRRVEG